MMLIYRGKTTGRIGSDKEHIEEALGVGPSSFFLSAKDLAPGSTTWVDSAGGNTGTFENTNYSILAEGERFFVRFTGCRLLFPTFMFSASGNAIIVLASVRLATGNSTNRTLVYQPRDTSGTYTLHTRVTTSHTVESRTYHSNGSTVTSPYVPTLSPRPGAWGMVAMASHGYPASVYGTLASHRVKHVRPYAQDNSTVSAYPLALRTTSGLPLMIGGARASGGTGAGSISEAFAGDIEWLGMWEVPCTSAELMRVILGRREIRQKAAGIGLLPKRDIDRVVFADRSRARTNNGMPIPTYSQANTYAPGTLVIHNGSGVDTLMQITSYARVPVTPPITAMLARMGGAPCAPGSSFNSQLAKQVDGTVQYPARSGPAISRLLRDGYTLACSSSESIARDNSLVAITTIDMSVGLAPYSSPYRALPAPKVFVRPYSITTGQVLEYGGGTGFHMSLENGLFNVRGFSFLGSFNGSSGFGDTHTAVKATRSTVFMIDTHTVASVGASTGVVYGHNVYVGPTRYGTASGTIYTTYPTAIKEITDASLDSGFTGGSIKSLCGRVSLGYSLLCSYAPTIDVRNSKVELQECRVENTPRFPGLSGPEDMYVSIAKGSTPYNATIDICSLSTRAYDNVSIGNPFGYTNMDTYMVLCRLSHVGGKPLAYAMHAHTYTKQFNVITGLYIADFPGTNSVTPYSLICNNRNEEEFDVRGDVPMVNTDYVELSVFVAEPGAKEFEIDFILLGMAHSPANTAAAMNAITTKVLLPDAFGVLQVLRDTRLRSGLDLHHSLSSTVVSKSLAGAWVGSSTLDSYMISTNRYFCGVKKIPVTVHAAGTVRIRVAISIATVATVLSPYVRVL